MPRQVQLVEMTEEEREIFVAEAYVEYLNRMVDAGRWTETNAQQRIDALVKSTPPDRHAAGQRFYRVIGDGEVVGGLWLQIDADILFVMQLTIIEASRQAGWGRAAMQEVEAMARTMGMRRLALNVFFNNTPALQLYESEGYSGYMQQMIKRLD
ncbi:MAG: GNAT family N-acetyltransferase [Burkholderiales bacterium]|nr:GNAT family N-acetyltransferase [Burkholderiales bacterium]